MKGGEERIAILRICVFLYLDLTIRLLGERQSVAVQITIQKTQWMEMIAIFIFILFLRNGKFT